MHEGPQRIAKTGTVALEPGMILSNEPGYYAAGRYGIRIENLVLVEPRAVEGGERPVFGFETLTLVPYDRRLIEPALLDTSERAWIDSYHARGARGAGAAPRRADAGLAGDGDGPARRMMRPQSGAKSFA